jgi:type II secretory pathway pseudopilin PulG
VNQSRRRQGFSFVEIIVGFAIAVVFFSGLLFFATSTRSETSKAERYLRALQIAQETIELVQATPFEKVVGGQLQIFEGSLVDPQTGRSAVLPVHPDAPWQPATRGYSDQYTKAYFYRRVRVDPVDPALPNARFLRKVTVEVFWNENKVPAHIEAVGGIPDRMRKLVLTTTIFDEREWY